MSFNIVKNCGLGALLLILFIVVAFAARVGNEVTQPVQQLVEVDLPLLQRLRDASDHLRKARLAFEIYRRRDRITSQTVSEPWRRIQQMLSGASLHDSAGVANLKHAVDLAQITIQGYIIEDQTGAVADLDEYRAKVAAALLAVRDGLSSLRPTNDASDDVIDRPLYERIANAVSTAEGVFLSYDSRELVTSERTLANLTTTLYLMQSTELNASMVGHQASASLEQLIQSVKFYRGAIVNYIDEELFDPSGSTLEELDAQTSHAWSLVRENLHDLDSLIYVNARALQVGMLERARGNMQLFLWMAGVAMFLAGFVSWFLSKLLSSRLRALAHGANQLSRGDLTHRIDASNRDELGQLAGTFNTMAEALERNLASIGEQHALLEAVFNRVPDGLLLLDESQRVADCNDGFATMCGQEKSAIIGRPVTELLGLSGYFDSPSGEGTDNGPDTDTVVGEYLCRRDNGSEFPAELYTAQIAHPENAVDRYILLVRDITRRKSDTARIRQLAYYDPLSGLPNRTLFKERLADALADAGRRNSQVALFYLDLDGFKRVNDTLGHTAGDGLLKEAARRMVELFGLTGASDAHSESQATVARLGGDEFIVLLRDVGSDEALAKVAQSINDVLSEPVRLEQAEVVVTTSIGIVTYPHGGGDEETLIKNADAAMYDAKRQGRNRYRIYAKTINAAARERLDLEGRLRRAMEREDLFLMYQPKFELPSGRSDSVEALVRWRDPEKGLVPPDTFVPIAEETGLIVPLGDWVLNCAARQARSWLDSGLPHICVAVNVSCRQFVAKDFINTVDRTLERYDLSATHLEVEITEGMLAEDTAGHILSALRDRGVTTSVDDFGTGYSSLNYLKRFPLNVLKIDRSFIKDVATDNDNQAIAKAIISMAHTLNLRVVAEGVEHQEQLQFLLDNNCDEVQGYFFTPPVHADNVIAAMRSHENLAAQLSDAERVDIVSGVGG